MPGVDVSLIDRSVAPCDDFFRFANGKWLERTEIPAEEPAYGGFTEVRDRNLEVMRAVADDAAKSAAPAGSVEQKVGDYWASALDEDAIEAAGIAPLQPELDLIASLTERSRLPDLLARLQRRRSGGGLGIAVRQDPGDSTRYILWLQQGGLGLPDRDYYLKDDPRSREIRAKYVRHVARMLELLGDGEDEARYGATTVLTIETRLALASMTLVDQRDPYKTYNKMTVAQLAERAPGFDWQAFLGALGARVDSLNVRQPGFFTELARAFADVPLEQLRTYLRWHLVLSAATALPKRFVDESFAFHQRELQGVERLQPRWKRVLGQMNGPYGDGPISHELGQLFVRAAFSAQAKQRVLELVEDLREALRERIAGLEWMGDATKGQARKKLDAFGVKIGYPDTWRDHSGLEVVRGEHLRNVFRAREWRLRRDLAKLGQPVDRTEWLTSPPTVNAFYNPLMNEICFPAGILQPPFFFPDADDATNYGAIGLVIGHEMSHGFDDAGSRYDADGNLKEWWSSEDRKAYEARQVLVVTQYEGYEPIPGQRINGKLTLGENIGDIGGLRIAWAAFQRMLARKGPQAPIDGFTAEQRFFLGYAQSWRSKIRHEALRVRLNTDPHSPSYHRVLGVLSNDPSFHEAFGCASGSTWWRAEELRPTIW